MDKCFKYRKHIKITAKISLFLSIPIAILIFVIGLLSKESFTIFLGLILFLESIFIQFFFKRIYTTELRISEAGISYTNSKYDIHFTFEEIIEIKTKSIKYTGGWMIIKVKGIKPIRLTVVVEDLASFIMMLKKALDEREMSSKYNEDKLKSFYLTSFYADYSWERSYYFMPRFLITIIIQMIFITIIAVLAESFIGLVIASSSIIIGIIPYLYYEYGIYVKSIRKKAKTQGWDLEIPDSALALERMKKAYRYYLYIGLAGILIHILLAIIY